MFKIKITYFIKIELNVILANLNRKWLTKLYLMTH